MLASTTIPPAGSNTLYEIHLGEAMDEIVRAKAAAGKRQSAHSRDTVSESAKSMTGNETRLLHLTHHIDTDREVGRR
jgi:hypothetical protein